MPADHYKTLGVSKDASEADIKKAYRKLARRYHPDRNGGDKRAEERFKEIGAAYEVLSDPAKRKAYDDSRSGQGARQGFKVPDPSTFAQENAFADVLSDIFTRPSQRQSSVRGRDIESELELSFAQAMAGAQVKLSLDSSRTCPTCKGTGAKPPSVPRVCPHCEGRGVEASDQGLFQNLTSCARCHGQGTVIDRPCPGCGGSGAERSTRTLQVNIPAGIRDGGRIRLAGRGGPGSPPGDLLITTHVEASPVFGRAGEHLEVEVPLSIPEALLGAVITVPTLSGAKRLRVKPGTRPGSIARLRGEGPPRPKGQGRGDIRYRFTLVVPKALSAEAERAVKALAEELHEDPRAHLFKAAAK